jgi:hypothetical protein
MAIFSMPVLVLGVEVTRDSMFPFFLIQIVSLLMPADFDSREFPDKSAKQPFGLS